MVRHRLTDSEFYAMLVRSRFRWRSVCLLRVWGWRPECLELFLQLLFHRLHSVLSVFSRPFDAIDSSLTLLTADFALSNFSLALLIAFL